MPDPQVPVSSALATIRGTLRPARANARSVAALTNNPGCARRRIIEAAGVRAFELAERLGHPVTRGQSPFAIANGNQFETRLKRGSKYALLVEALRPFVTFPPQLRVADLGFAKGVVPGDPALRVRASRTDEVLVAIARGDPDAPHIVDHPVLILEITDTPVFLEPDALAFRVGTHLELVEIKSYPIIDDQADPSKLAATGGQSAVYLLALRATLQRLGFDPKILSQSVILVAPRNFGRTPTAHRVPLRKKLMALERVLASLPSTGSILGSLGLPSTFTFDVDPTGKNPVTKMKADLDQAIRSLPMLYIPECLSACDLAKYCRHQAITDDCPSRLGRDTRDTLAGVSKLQDVLRLATKGPGPREIALCDVADSLQSAYQALKRARSRVPGMAMSPPPGPAKPPKRQPTP